MRFLLELYRTRATWNVVSSIDSRLSKGKRKKKKEKRKGKGKTQTNNLFAVYPLGEEETKSFCKKKKNLTMITISVHWRRIGYASETRTFLAIKQLRSWKIATRVFTILANVHDNRNMFKWSHLRKPCDFSWLFTVRLTMLAKKHNTIILILYDTIWARMYCWIIFL